MPQKGAKGSRIALNYDGFEELLQAAHALDRINHRDRMAHGILGLTAYRQNLDMALRQIIGGDAIAAQLKLMHTKLDGPHEEKFPNLPDPDKKAMRELVRLFNVMKLLGIPTEPLHNTPHSGPMILTAVTADIAAKLPPQDLSPQDHYSSGQPRRPGGHSGTIDLDGLNNSALYLGSTDTVIRRNGDLRL